MASGGSSAALEHRLGVAPGHVHVVALALPSAKTASRAHVPPGRSRADSPDRTFPHRLLLPHCRLPLHTLAHTWADLSSVVGSLF